MIGTVVKSTGKWCSVKTDDHQYINCQISGKIRLQLGKNTNPIAVGDRVEFTLNADQTGYLQQVLPRNNYLIRKATNLSKQYQVIAANLDQLALVVTIKKPKIATGFIDRYLVTTQAFDIPTLLVINKSDLITTEDEEEYLSAIAFLYKNIDYSVYITSCIKNQGLNDLKQALLEKRTLFSGFSGVGKSSLLNALFPMLDRKTGAISAVHEKGKHTTTFAEMFTPSLETEIIDTPGIKELGIVDIAPWELGRYFKDIKPFVAQCKFNTCLHLNEPDCAVMAAVAAHKIATERYLNYCSILNELRGEKSVSKR